MHIVYTVKEFVYFRKDLCSHLPGNCGLSTRKKLINS